MVRIRWYQSMMCLYSEFHVNQCDTTYNGQQQSWLATHCPLFVFHKTRSLLSLMASFLPWQPLTLNIKWNVVLDLLVNPGSVTLPSQIIVMKYRFCKKHNLSLRILGLKQTGSKDQIYFKNTSVFVHHIAYQEKWWITGDWADSS